MSSAETGTAAAALPAPTQGAVRRLIVFVLLLSLVVVTATGVAGLLSRLLPGGEPMVIDDTAGLARSLAFTLVGGPLAGVLWWLVWRRLDTGIERRSLAWGLYVAGVCTIALVAATTALLSTGAALVGGPIDPGLLASGLVWAAVWGVHRWMLRHAERGPQRLVTLGPVIGAAFGLVIGVGGWVTAVGTVFDAALRAPGLSGSVGDPWWFAAVQGLVWGVGGSLVWWWHWAHDDTRHDRTALAGVALILTGILGAGILTLSGAGVSVFVALRLLVDRTEPVTELLNPLGTAVAAGGIGAVVWVYHRAVTQRRDAAVRQAARLVTSGVALVAAASGLGVIVNALLASATISIAGSGSRTLLLAGLSALLVGGPVWWSLWRPVQRPEPGRSDIGSPGRRTYLIVVFGLSAVVALITVLVLGYRVFEMILDPVSGRALLERVRAPLGLIVSTGLVAVYHLSVWRSDRAENTGPAAAGPPAISRVFLLADPPAAELITLVERTTKARVTLWPRRDATVPAATARLGWADIDAMLVSDLQGVSARRVVLISGPDGRLQVVPLAD
ncbi:MAG: DUF5671 domain-containing protein [Cryobacterium sp.]